MTIHYQPDDPESPTKIDVWHVADDGTEAGPVEATGDMSDTMGDICPDAVRSRLIKYLKNNENPSDPLWQGVVYDMLELDYVEGPP
jgi:hypothetical protein